LGMESEDGGLGQDNGGLGLEGGGLGSERLGQQGRLIRPARMKKYTIWETSVKCSIH
jgi:hypothetical protein